MPAGMCALMLVAVPATRPAIPSAAAPSVGRAVASRAVPVAPAGTNLIRNGGAEIADPSATGYDAVTIPGWRVVTGLPSVIAYGTPGMIGIGAPRPPSSGRNLFVGGAGGPASIAQRVPLRFRPGPLPVLVTYNLSAALGGLGADRDDASVVASFEGSGDKVLATAVLGPVTAHERGYRTGLLARGVRGELPGGTTSVVVVVHLNTRAKDYNGPDGSTIGFDYAYADDVSLRLSVPVVAPPVIRRPVARVPRFDHVFLVYLENEDYGSIIGNTKQAPFINSLLPRSSLLADMFAEEHPSDANYLAFAGGSTFGLPLDDPAEEESLYTIDAKNIADLLDEAHESWKGYLQSANGPCDDTVHDYYWDDDLPLMYFKDIRERPAYCAAHVVPLQKYAADLKSAATTPSFGWIGPNDCDDMEGCGIAAGDSFLKTIATELFASQAWRTEPSMLIVTWDEDGEDGQHPAQRIPTLVIGSRYVKPGYVSTTRYTHYSLLRTVEAALGLGTLTDNDAYAPPLNDVFGSRGLAEALASTPASIRRAASQRPLLAYVADSATGTVTPVDVTANTAGKAIRVGGDPDAIAVAPNGKTVYVADASADAVTPIEVPSNRVEPAIAVGKAPDALAISPDGKTMLVANEDSETVTPIDLATDRAGPAIGVGSHPISVIFGRDGRLAYVLDWGSGEVSEIAMTHLRAGPPLKVGSYPEAMALSPDGSELYVANFGSDSVSPIETETWRSGRPIPVGQAPDAVSFSPGGHTAYVVNGDSDTVTPIDVADSRAGRAIRVGSSPSAVAFGPDGRTAYVLNTVSSTVTPIATGTRRPGRAISVGAYTYPVAIEMSPRGNVAEVVDDYAGEITTIDLATGTARTAIQLGSTTFPTAIAIVG